MKKIFILSFMLFLGANYVFSADWYANENKGFFIDKDSLIKTENSVKAWVLYVAHGKINNKKYAYTEQYMEARCSDKTMATLEVVYFSRKHKSLASYNFGQQNMIQYNRVVPDTRGEAIFNDLCSMR